MLKETNPLQAVFLNLLLLALWHFCMFIACISVSKSLFRPSRALYQPRSWEKNGRWYNDRLHIKKWKDSLPIHTGKDGFDKSSFLGRSLSYIDEFIFETCRGEWDHWMNCLFALIALMINSLVMGLIFALLTVLINLPFIAIQRYNRFRLQALREHLLRGANRSGVNRDEAFA